MKKIVTLALVALALAALAGCGTNQNESGGGTAGAAGTQEIGPGESLVIPIAELTGTAKFYPVKVNGSVMEVLAVKTDDGRLRTAFNTCQVCNGSPYAYFEQQGGVLQCQNCGNQFPMNQVEVEAGGCNPWPIFAKDKTVTSTEIRIEYAFLAANTGIFNNWKQGL